MPERHWRSGGTKIPDISQHTIPPSVNIGVGDAPANFDFSTMITNVVSPCSFTIYAPASIVSINPLDSTLAAEMSSITASVLTIDPSLSADADKLQGRSIGYEIVI